jgi:hypothetical protein
MSLSEAPQSYKPVLHVIERLIGAAVFALASAALDELSNGSPDDKSLKLGCLLLKGALFADSGKLEDSLSCA